MRNVSVGVVAAIVVSCCFLAFPMVGALPPGTAKAAFTVDDSFGSHGFTVLPLLRRPALKLDRQKRIYVAGERNGIVRLTRNGDNDRSFGVFDRGYGYSAAFVKHGDSPGSYLVEPALRRDGSLTVGMELDYGADGGGHAAALAALNRRGRSAKSLLRDGFWSSGRPIDGIDRSLNAVLPMADGATLVAESTDRWGPAGARPSLASVYMVDRHGRLDRTFGGDGRLVIAERKSSRDGFHAHGFADLARASNGNVLALAYLSNRLVLLRVDRHGNPVRSFGVRGKARLPVRSTSWCPTGIDCHMVNSLAIGAKHNAFVLAQQGSKSNPILLSVTSDGRFRRRFGHHGAVELHNILRNGKPFFPSDFSVDSTGRVVLAGSSLDGGNESSVVLRLKRDGSLDHSFAPKGFLELEEMDGASSVETIRRGFIVAGTFTPEIDEPESAIITRLKLAP